MTDKSQFGDIQPGEVEAMAKDNVRRMTEKAQFEKNISDAVRRIRSMEESDAEQYLMMILNQSHTDKAESQADGIEIDYSVWTNPDGTVTTLHGIAAKAMSDWASASIDKPLHQIIREACDQSRAEGVESQEETIQRLRGSLQNCVNHLNRKRRYDEQEYDECIDQANRVLYETLNGATNDTDL